MKEALHIIEARSLGRLTSLCATSSLTAEGNDYAQYHRPGYHRRSHCDRAEVLGSPLGLNIQRHS